MTQLLITLSLSIFCLIHTILSISIRWTCGTHTLCVSGGAHHSPTQMQHSWAKICTNLYVLYMPDSSRCIVEAISHRKCNFFNVLDMSFENFKQLVLGHLDVHFSWESHRIHHHLSKQNVYSDFHSILDGFLYHFEKLTLSRTPTRWGCLEAPKGCPIRKYDS